MNFSLKSYIWIATIVETDLTVYLPPTARLLGFFSVGGGNLPVTTASIVLRWKVAGISMLLCGALTTSDAAGNSLALKWFGSENNSFVEADAEDPALNILGEVKGSMPSGLPILFDSNIGQAVVTVQVTIGASSVLGGVWYTDDPPHPCTTIAY